MILFLAWPVQADNDGGASHSVASTFLWIAIILLIAKFSSLIEHIGQPSVLGELVAGVILGNLVIIGIPFFETPKNDPILLFFAELGVVILLFQVGLESNLTEMGRVGHSAALVGIVGIVAPFVLGTYLIGPLLLPGLGFYSYLFLGAALTATSVGITARVFQDLGKLQSSEAKIVLGAAVIDDVLGLIILAVISAVVTAGSVSIGQVVWIITKSITFLVVTIVSGLLLAPHVNRLFSKINAGIGMKFTLIASSGLIFAYLAEVIGLAPIVGAFAAGLVLEPIHYRDFKDPEVIDDLRTTLKDTPGEVKGLVNKVIEAHSNHHVEELVEPVAHFFVPIFFVMTGMVVKLDVLLNPAVLLVALGVTLVAIIGKLVAGLAATRRTSRWLIGWSMVPRGEVGLIFATIGKSLGVVTDEVFSVIVIMVILTTFITPPALTFLIKRQPVSIPEEEEVLPRHADFYRRDASQILWESFESRFGKKPTRLLKQLRIRGIHWKIPTKR
jgi:Kef-type K+ transport system membrane component KefB